jgi:hypothetical protein
MHPPPALFSCRLSDSSPREPPSLPIVLFLFSLVVASGRTSPAVALPPMALVAWLSDLHQGVRWGMA